MPIQRAKPRLVDLDQTPLTSMPAGTVLQVKHAFQTTQIATTSTSWADISGLSVSLTCSSTSNKVLLFCSLQLMKDTETDNSWVGTAFAAAGTRICTNHGYCMRGSGVNTGSYGSTGNSFLHSPSSTSAITYTIQWRSGDGQRYYVTTNNSGNVANGNDSSTSTFTVMEIAG